MVPLVNESNCQSKIIIEWYVEKEGNNDNS